MLAFGAQEQHGPHLPLSTDTLIAGELARRLAVELDALLLPPVPYGETWNTSGYPGTVTISFATVQALLVDIARSVQAHGVRALLVVNGHFGNRAPLEQAARQLLSGDPFPVLLLDHPGLAELAGEICSSSPAAPDLLPCRRGGELPWWRRAGPSSCTPNGRWPSIPTFPATFGAEPIRLDTFCRSGVFGDPRPATAAKGEALYAGLVRNCLSISNRF